VERSILTPGNPQRAAAVGKLDLHTESGRRCLHAGGDELGVGVVGVDQHAVGAWIQFPDRRGPDSRLRVTRPLPRPRRKGGCRAGSAAAPAARCKKLRRGSFMMPSPDRVKLESYSRSCHDCKHRLRVGARLDDDGGRLMADATVITGEVQLAASRNRSSQPMTI
jgi:hypothetical protein